MATAAAVFAQTAVRIAQFIKRIFQTIKDLALKLKNFAFAKLKWAWEKTAKARAFFVKAWQFTKSMKMLAVFFPIVAFIKGVRNVFGALFKFLVMVLAYIVVGFLIIGYELGCVPGFYHILYFTFYYIPFQLIPALVIALIYIAIFLFAVIIFGILVAIDKLTGGSIRVLSLCQNPIGAWYRFSRFEKNNKFKRGLMCSRPCMKGYVLEPMTDRCVRLPVNTPSFGPQAMTMRLYTGMENGALASTTPLYMKNYEIYRPHYLSKEPEEREKVLMQEYKKAKDYQIECSNPSNPVDMNQYNYIMENIYQSIASLKKNGLTTITDANMENLRKVCYDKMCTPDSSYPACAVPAAGVARPNGRREDVLRNIVNFTLTVIAFVLTISFILQGIQTTKRT